MRNKDHKDIYGETIATLHPQLNKSLNEIERRF